MGLSVRLAPYLLVLLGIVIATPARAQETPARGGPEETASDDTAPAYPPPSTRWKLVFGGLGTSAVFYGAATGMSYLYPDAPGAKDLRIPVAGPWLAIAHNGCPADEPDCSGVLVAIRTIITAIDGLGQAGGLAILLEGIFVPTQERAAAPKRAPTPKPSTPSAPPSTTPPSTPPTEPKNLYFLPTPMTVGARGIGVGVLGRF
jgi:hypothetical protein